MSLRLRRTDDFMHAFFSIFASLRLTVVTLAMALVLVFVGTLAQVHMGLYLAQERYFSSLFVFWGPQGADWKIPVWPGGYLLGGILLLNLIAAHIKRFTFSRKKFGIFIVHGGLILMFVGQFATQLLQVESFMAIKEGATRNYSESSRASELAIIDVTDPGHDKVVAIPERILADKAHGGEIRTPELPFAIKVDKYYLNSVWKFEPGKGMSYDPLPRTTKMNDRDIPAATVEMVADGASKGQFTVSDWESDENLAGDIQKNFGPGVPTTWAGPKHFSYNGREYLVAMRARRYYKPFSLTLLNFSHDLYLGTKIPKNFSSRIKLKRPETGEDREVLIYMNNPLRYAGETYYQASFFPDDSGTILQVVRNPSWLTPYVACVMVGTGLVVQFLSHLIGFAKKRRA
jgi:hypothetical protein